MSVEEKIRRAEEIYNRRRGEQNNNYTTRVNVNSKKHFKLFKKLIWQIIICLCIYSCYYMVDKNNYIFSADVMKKTQEVLSYDINFNELYNKGVNYINGIYNTQENNNDNNVEEDENVVKNENEEKIENSIEENKVSSEENTILQEQNIGGAEAEKVEDNNSKETVENNKELSQEEKDILDIKNTINFIKPIEGTISSTFGWRNPTTSTVPKYHTGLDIAANIGTVIKSATDGTVSLASSEGDYRKSFKNS